MKEAQTVCYPLDSLIPNKNWNFSEDVYLSENFLHTCNEVVGPLNTFSENVLFYACDIT